MKFEFFNRAFYFLANEEQRAKLANFLKSYLIGKPAAFLAMGICLLIFILLIVALFSKDRKRKIINIIMAFLYTFVLILIFLLNRDPGVRRFSIAMVSDYLTENGYHESMIILAALYVLTFIPYGFLLRKAMGKKHKGLRLLAIIVMAAGIEVAQYVFSRGVSSLVDIAMYIIGAYIGVLIMSIFGLIDDLFKHLEGKFKKDRNEISKSGLV